ncbi:MAG: hypothetical protein M9925_10210 [Chloroflexi bacterium]|nr:hypothetical protein [Chloroflexota bacterium]MCZ7577430.1 hypothetical protein [Dehalococcoidia bacterium]NJD66926.1 hypothetical protein [Chloroflexota bacterium]PWB43771.1 MAG: hypothetical protein C3F10_10070 [Dehalococcoidia bacterium]
MPFLHSHSVRSWLLFMAVLLALGLADLILQPSSRDAAVIALAVGLWATLLLAGLLVIALAQGARGLRMHRTP